MIYNSLNELENKTLNINDTVYFYVNGKQFKYNVNSDHLSNVFTCDNAAIFSILNVKKEDFCSTFYGYIPYGGMWPSCKHGDFSALTRVVKALYREIEHKKAKEVSALYSESKNLIQELKTSLSATLSNPLSTTSLVLEKKEDTSSNILIRRKSKIKRIIGEEPIKLNNY